MPDATGTAAAEAFEAAIREHEESWLSPLAVRSYETAGRREDEDECGVRTPFQRDRDRIVHSKSFRRLKHKTQVFIDPRGDHYRTRLTHTLETAGISRTVARALRLNEDLTEAIALGHDLGHPPFGHTGEQALDDVLRERFGRRFRHNEHSLRVVDVLERNGRGLNLTYEVRDGILRHTGPEEPATLEGKIVRLVDRVAYINHDIDDAVRAGVLDGNELPADDLEILGETGSKRIDRLVHDLVEHSAAAGDIVQGDEVGRAMANLRALMFEHVYLDAAPEQRDRGTATIRRIVTHLVEHPDDLPPGRPGDLPQRATDHVAGMTDRFALNFPRDPTG
jgi:dGTPase